MNNRAQTNGDSTVNQIVCMIKSVFLNIECVLWIIDTSLCESFFASSYLLYIQVPFSTLTFSFYILRLHSAFSISILYSVVSFTILKISFYILSFHSIFLNSSSFKSVKLEKDHLRIKYYLSNLSLFSTLTLILGFFKHCVHFLSSY